MAAKRVPPFAPLANLAGVRHAVDDKMGDIATGLGVTQREEEDDDDDDDDEREE